MRKIKIYILAQLIGWFSYVLLAGIISQLSGEDADGELFVTLFSVFAIGLFTSHLYRTCIHFFGWKSLHISKLIPRLLLAIVGMALLFQLLFYLITSIFINQDFSIQWAETFQQIVNWGIIFLIWTLIYFIYHFFENFRKQEIINLQWQATKNEVELNQLKSQLNPHFIFNSMNTIRALIDEDPQKAKRSITRLSNILRSSFTMGKQKTVSLEEELRLVEDYLEIEKTRFEERLHCEQNIHPDSLGFPVPSMMLQTIVENAIKHGISKLSEGGTVCIHTQFQVTKLVIEVINDGHYTPNSTSNSGYGLKNTQQRLELLYGKDATLSIENTENQHVKTTVILPNNTKL